MKNDKNDRLSDGLEQLLAQQEAELINRAKKVLMAYLNMTEPQAHQFIVKQAMNLRRSKVDIAEGVLKTYEL